MARNPITSESLTVDFKQLMRIPVGTRAQAASVNSDFLASILTLTPSQIAQAFPDYYKRQLPDVSNFITANIQAKLSGRGRTWDQTGGGTPGTDPGSYYTEEGKLNPRARPAGAPKPTVDEMKKELLKNGINVDNVYNVIDEKGILANDKRIEFLKNLSKEELAKAGLEKVETEDGKSLIRETATQASQMSDQDVLSKVAGRIAPGTEGLEGRAAMAKMTYDSFIDAGLSDNQARAIVAEVNRENSLNPEYMFGTHAEMASHVKGRTNYGIFSWGDPSRAKQFRKHMMENGVMDANGNIIVDNKTYLDQQARFAVQELQGYESGKQFLANKEVSYEEGVNLLGRYIGWDMAGRRHDASASYDRLQEGRKIIDEVNEKFGKILPENPSDAQIEEARKLLAQRELEARETALTEALYGQASPTSSQSIPDPDGKTTVPLVGKNIKPVGSDFESLKDFWSQRNPRTDLDRVMKVDPDLLKSYAEAIQQYEASNPGYRVELFGPGAAARDIGSTSNHGIKGDGYSKALDVVIVDRATGKQITNLGDEGYSGQIGGSELASKEYTRLHSLARIAQEYYAPEELNLRQGGGFSPGSSVPADWMHGDIRSESMGSYSWERGYDPSFRRRYGIQENLVLGDEERIRKLGEQIYGQVDEKGYYTNRAAFEQTETGDTTVVSKKLEKPEELQTATAEVPKLALGGSLHGLNEDMTLVETESGQPIAQIGQNERFEKQGNAVQVTPETKLKADELTDKYDISEMETQISEVEERLMQQQQNNQMNQKPREPERIKNEPDSRWHEMSAQISPLAAPYERAIARAKFLPEGYHYGRGMHSSIT